MVHLEKELVHGGERVSEFGDTEERECERVNLATLKRERKREWVWKH